MENLKSIYFIGIGGIGMSNLARYFLSKGKRVAGYDKTATVLTQQLEDEGAIIHYIENINLIPDFCTESNSTLVVYTPAISSNNEEFCYFEKQGFTVLKRSEVLGLITKSSKALCCAGTHGKTTTSSMLAHILKGSHLDCNAFLGGILKNYNNNLLLSDTSSYTVIEADEYDRSFHHLEPYMALITSASPDHLDIYETETEYLKSFEYFTSLIKSGGALVIKNNLNIKPRLKEKVKLYTYSENQGDFHAKNLKIGNGTIIFDFVTPGGLIKNIELGVPVRINIENSIGAMALAWLNGVSDVDLRRGIFTYQGTKRRFDFILKSDKVVLIDDYAHHPEELEASISSVKTLYPTRKLTGIFQPHLYTRTRDLANEFAESLSLLDELILLDIYPAREQPIEGVTSEIIFDKVKCKKEFCKKEDLLDLLIHKDIDVLLTIGAGDIDHLLPTIKQCLSTKYKI